MSHYVYIYFVNFSYQLFLMEAIFTKQLKRRSHFWIRLGVLLISYFAIGMLLIREVRKIPQEFYPAAIVYYIGLFSVSLLFLYVLFDAKLKDILFIGTAGYALQHIAFSVQTIVSYTVRQFGGLSAQHETVYDRIFWILFYILVAVVSYRTLVKHAIDRELLKVVNLKMILLSLGILLISCVLSVFATGMDAADGALSNVICRLYAIASCSFGLVVQFDIARQNRLETNNVILEQLLYQEKHQHEISKENIMMINMKCHDLKHQIQELKKVDNRDMRTKLIDEMKESIMIYDSNVKSGNDTIDLILTEKSLICQRDNIKFSYIIDGAKLDFIEVADLYALFGNALDNAIESVEKEPEERRIISLNIRQKNEMVMIHLENYCNSQLKFVDGLPETTKDDRRYHGYGTRSIRYIVEKYHGFMEMRQEEGKFILEVLFNRV